MKRKSIRKHNMILSIFKAVKTKRIILLHSNFTITKYRFDEINDRLRTEINFGYRSSNLGSLFYNAQVWPGSMAISVLMKQAKE